jgi:hypothetical protein
MDAETLGEMFPIMGSVAGIAQGIQPAVYLLRWFFELRFFKLRRSGTGL